MERFRKGLRYHAMKKLTMKKKEMIALINKISLMKSKRFVTYAEKYLVLMKMIKMYLNYTMKSETIAITLENLVELLIVFAI